MENVVLHSLLTQIDDAVTERVVSKVTGLRSGSIIGYVEVTVVSPRTTTTYELLKESISSLGNMDQNGIVSVTTSKGDIITFDSNRLDVAGQYFALRQC